MHARIEHLLSLRDGEPVEASVRAHVEACPRCTASLAETVRLRDRLRALPAAPSAEAGAGWAAVMHRKAARESSARTRGRVVRWATAASIAIVAVAVAWRIADVSPVAPAKTIAAITPLTAEQAIASDRVAQLQTQSAALEELLAALGEPPVVERAGATLPIDTLEAQVQWIDHRLLDSRDDSLEAEQLWRERVQAMNSLVQLRYVEAQRMAAM